MASGYEMKAKPVPLFTTLEMSSIFMLYAKLPKIPKIVMPAIKLVNVSSVVTINTSLYWHRVSREEKTSNKKGVINFENKTKQKIPREMSLEK